MGRATIISGGEAGRYSVSLDYDDARKSLILARIEAQIEFYQDQLETITDPNARARRELWIAALRKRRDFLQDPDICPTDRTVDAWCADLTEDLSGTVGTIEIDSQPGTVLIRPGYDGNAVYNALRDGQLQALFAQSPEASVFNWMLHDGRVKWHPRHRLATLTAVDHELDTCALTLAAASGAMTGEDVNLQSSLSDVPIEYMTCNSAPFEAGDSVVVEFTDNDWTQPVVIGFADNPKACDHDYCIITANPRPWDPDGAGVITPDQWSIVWDVGMNCMAAEIPASATPEDYLTFPCKTDDLAYWASITEARTNSASLTWDSYGDLAAEVWEAEEPGEPFIPDGGEAMCNACLYTEYELSDYNYKTWTQDKYKWTSATNVADTACSQRTINQTSRDVHPKVDGKVYPGTPTYPMQYIEYNSPLGAFESFVSECQIYVCEYYAVHSPPDSPWNFFMVPYPYYHWEWWGFSWPSLVPQAIYSENSHVQIYAHYNCTQRIETIGGDPSAGWVYDTQNITKLQIHAAASYHPSEEKTGAVNANPLGLSRNTALEAALYDLLQTQLAAEDATHGQDWSRFELDEDHDPSWPGPGETTLFTAAASETYQVPLLYSLTFDIQFRQYPEEEE